MGAVKVFDDAAVILKQLQVVCVDVCVWVWVLVWVWVWCGCGVGTGVGVGVGVGVFESLMLCVSHVLGGDVSGEK